MNSPTSLTTILVKPVSADCNLACTYCFYSKKFPQPRRMTAHVLRELIAQVMQLSIDRVTFCWQGGEPTLSGIDFYQKALEYQKLFGIPGQHIENSLQTNGVLLNEQWGRFLADAQFLVGVSLDGPPAMHNHFRKDLAGASSYDAVREGISWLRRYHVNFNVLVLLSQANIHYPRILYDFLTKNGFQYLQFIPCVESDTSSGQITDYSITPEQYGQFLCETFTEWTRDNIPTVYVRNFDDILLSYVTGQAASCTFAASCGHYLVVEFNGDVYPCDFYVRADTCLGNIMEQSLEDIVHTSVMRQFVKQKPALAATCSNCQWLKHCNAGCPRHWGFKNYPRNYFCRAYQMLFEHSHAKLLELKEMIQQKHSRNQPQSKTG